LGVVRGQPPSTIEEVEAGGRGDAWGDRRWAAGGAKGGGARVRGEAKEGEGGGRGAGGDGGVEAEPTRGREEDVSPVVQ
jgi:hypothetical protein